MAEDATKNAQNTQNAQTAGNAETSPSIEELKAQLESLQHELATAKANLSKANGEAAENKRKLREFQTADQVAEEERAKKEAEREARIAELEKIVNVTNFKSKYLALGMDEQMAKETAEAFANGETDKVFENLGKFNANQRKVWEAERLDKQPNLPNGDVEKAITKEQFATMDYNARAKLYSENPEAYKNLTGGNS